MSKATSVINAAKRAANSPYFASGLAGAATAIVDVCAFSLSFHGLSELGSQYGNIPGGMSWMLPLTVDVFQLGATVATIALASKGARFYAWSLMLFTTALSVLLNITYAGLSTHGRVIAWGIAAGFPVLLLFSTHLTVMVVLDARRKQSARATKAEVHELALFEAELAPAA